MLRQSFLALLFGCLLAVGAAAPTGAQERDPENVLVMELKDGGRVLIQMMPAVAPKHVEQIKTLTRRGFYDGVVFHRVMPDFMAQTGDPTGTGRGSSDLPDIPAEFSMEPFNRGAVGMARSPDPNSANSQWFICFQDCSFLEGDYTVWGRVIEGMEYVDQIKKAPAGRESGMVDDPDKLISLKVLADVQ